MLPLMPTTAIYIAIAKIMQFIIQADFKLSKG